MPHHMLMKNLLIITPVSYSVAGSGIDTRLFMPGAFPGICTIPAKVPLIRQPARIPKSNSFLYDAGIKRRWQRGVAEVDALLWNRVTHRIKICMLNINCDTFSLHRCERTMASLGIGIALVIAVLLYYGGLPGELWKAEGGADKLERDCALQVYPAFPIQRRWFSDSHSYGQKRSYVQTDFCGRREFCGPLTNLNQNYLPRCRPSPRPFGHYYDDWHMRATGHKPPPYPSVSVPSMLHELNFLDTGTSRKTKNFRHL
ncbi:hypothetical protein DFS33DRAFT_1456800 [Desarmillaria ectypa]|nr:hypothetical protein DFS33DRAFT_1456800 [Desarmillaria ectypa]